MQFFILNILNSAGIGRTGTILSLFNLVMTYKRYLPEIRNIYHLSSL